MKISDISVLGRVTQGVRLINLKDSDEKVTGLALVDADEEEANGAAPAGEDAPPQVH